jgi:AsmA protein
MHLSIFPPRFVVDDATITDDPTFNMQRPFVHVMQMGISLKLLPLLQRSVEIDSLYLQRPMVELIRNREGKWNFSSLGGGTSRSSSPGKKRFSLSEMVIQNGRVALTDLQARQPRSIYDHIDASLKDFAPEEVKSR